MDYQNEFPLRWPAGVRRSVNTTSAAFKVEPKVALDHMLNELRLLGARDIILSTNRPVNRDGSLSIAKRNVYDIAIAVYFKRKGRDVVLACDQFDRLHDNIRAVGKTIEAMRGIERWGSTDMLDRAFTGFEALPAPEQWWQVLGVSSDATKDQISAAYRERARECHNRGGTDSDMARINLARDAALATHNQKDLSLG